MKNIYFPEEDIKYNDLFFVCYMIERVARHIKQRNKYVVQKLGKKGLERQLSIAESLHCLNPEKVVSDWVEEFKLERGVFDVTKIDSRFTDRYPSETQMGKIYARLVSSIATDGNWVEGVQNVYASPICDVIDNYNASAYYEPSYVQVQAFYKGEF
ncbi:MAG: hypothetical protein MJZ46_01790 [Bacteroidales bacterium]|nr:hypothetical protein [Bacteroidales bacterium]MCQ2270859.1 hypothetical protein [Bacteroidales bacterium]